MGAIENPKSSIENLSFLLFFMLLAISVKKGLVSALSPYIYDDVKYMGGRDFLWKNGWSYWLQPGS